MAGGRTKLTSTVSVDKYKNLEQNNDRPALAKFFRQRFAERYFRPVESSTEIHGFTILAVCCLALETLESFYQGEADTKGKSKQMFHDFFDKRAGALTVFGGGNDWFYKDIRCGILHQAESRNGWRVWRFGPLLESKAKIINAQAFLRELKISVDVYANALEDNQNIQHWDLFKKKMKAVCDNCG
jgi:hypothetical protein